jgi:hypothetical protein
VLARHAKRRRKVRRITVDLDITDDPTHGARRLSFFNSFYDTWRCLPVLAFATFDREPEQRGPKSSSSAAPDPSPNPPVARS